jgi:glycosyltransferase involved in cell wall biosynthesis
MSSNILALGDRSSAAYSSISDAVRTFGKVTFRNENSFKAADEAFDFIRESAFDAVLMPNPYGNERRRSVYEMLRSVNFPVVVFDRGALPNSWFFDTGFNADSISYRPSQWDHPLRDAELKAVEAYIGTLKNELPALEAQGERIGGPALKERLGIGDRKLLFVPLQRPSDTTTRFFISPLRTLDDFHHLITGLADRLKGKLADWVIVAKRHPLEVVRPDIPVVFADDAHVYDLIEASDAVLTVNSGTGLLSMCWEKPVLLAGTAFYADPRLNSQATSVDDVERSLRNPLEVDRTTRDRFIHNLLNRVYSFGKFETELVLQEDGAYRNITRRIDFEILRVPECLKRKSLLFVTSVIPWPIDRGSVHRTEQMLRSLVEQGLNIDLICLNQSEPNASVERIRNRLRKRFPGLRRIDVLRHPKFIDPWTMSDVIGRIGYVLSSLADSLLARAGTINATGSCPPNLAKQIRSRLSSGIYDYVWFNYLRVMPRTLHTNSQVICDLHDFQTNRIREDVLPRLKPQRREDYLRRYERSEFKALTSCDKAIAISPIEAERFAKDPRVRSKIYCIPATDDTQTQVESGSGPKYDLLYIGSRSDANVAGLAWFLHACFPLIVARKPDVRLLIQGNIIDTPFLTSGDGLKLNGANITLSGPLENLASVYGDGKIVICPVLHGTGMKIKMVEAMAFGKAIVATSKAAEGIATNLGLTTHDTAEDFASACIEALDCEASANRRRAVSAATFDRDHDRMKVMSSTLRALFDH